MRAERAQEAFIERSSGLLGELAVHERNAIHRASVVQLCAAGDVLLRSDARSRSVFFPIDSVVSLVRPLREDRAIAVALFGKEGVVGFDAVLGTSRQLDDVVVQSPGAVYAMPVEDLRHQFEGTGRLQKAVLRFTHALIDQVAQNVVCTRYHSVGQRLSKWLLMIDDRSGSIDAASASRLLARMLGAEEAEIERALARLTAAGAVGQRSNGISIERDVLEVGACECYEALRVEGRGTHP